MTIDGKNETTPGAAADGLLARLQGSAAARDMFYVLSAQGLATLVVFAVDSFLYKTLPVEEQGVLRATLALQGVLLVLCDLGTSLTTIRVGSAYYAKGQTDEANATFRRALNTRLILAVGISAAAYFLAPALAGYPLRAGNRLQLVWAAAASLSGLTLMGWGVDVAQSRRRFGTYFALQLLSAIARAWIIWAVVKRLKGTEVADEQNLLPKLGAEPVLWAIACACCLGGMLSVLLQRDVLKPGPKFKPDIDKDVQREMWSIGKSSIAIVMLGGITAQIELLMLQSLLTSKDTAVYNGALRFAMVLPMLTTALATVLLTRAAALDSAQACAAYVRKALKVSAPLALLSAGGLALSAQFLVPVFWGEKYAESVPVLHWLSLAFAFNVLLNPLTLALYPLRREGAILLLNALQMVLSVAAGWLLIPRYGALGAAWSVLLVRAVVMLAGGAVVAHGLKHPPAFVSNQPKPQA
jgi:O-antigen/teichoic acid export membrane protein